MQTVRRIIRETHLAHPGYVSPGYANSYKTYAKLRAGSPPIRRIPQFFIRRARALHAHSRDVRAVGGGDGGVTPGDAERRQQPVSCNGHIRKALAHVSHLARIYTRRASKTAANSQSIESVQEFTHRNVHTVDTNWTKLCWAEPNQHLRESRSLTRRILPRTIV